MNDGYAWWLLIAGVGVGVCLAWLIIGRVPRNDDDIAVNERAVEAGWISRNIASYGGVAPEPLVEEVLELHQHYLNGPGIDPEHAAWLSPPDAATGSVSGATFEEIGHAAQVSTSAVEAGHETAPPSEAEAGDREARGDP